MAAPAQKLVINPLVGRKVETWYPDHGGWYPGIITDYNLENDKHWCAISLKCRQGEEIVMETAF